MWLEDYCPVCMTVSSSGTLYCSETCRLHDQEQERTKQHQHNHMHSHSQQSSPSLIPSPLSFSESSRRSSAVQVLLEPPAIMTVYNSTANAMIPDLSLYQSNTNHHGHDHLSGAAYRDTDAFGNYNAKSNMPILGALSSFLV
ncbi:uncharacterized protein V1516DRAFT_713545 [Lipomyces oligophaga]|uniref:uncharacterized protein n=1 Tax=Lipomyces oligophaga TaxID=45792 RepID=UPI0034CD01AB